jgi:glutaminase
VEAASRLTFARGQRIVTEGEAADGVYLLVSGSVSVGLTLASGEPYRIATMDPGAVFGELALMDAAPRTADVDAETDVACYFLRVADLEPGAQSALVAQLARQLAARLRRADREIASLAS